MTEMPGETVIVPKTDLEVLVRYFTRTDGGGVRPVSYGVGVAGGAGGSGWGMSHTTSQALDAAIRIKAILSGAGDHDDEA